MRHWLLLTVVGLVLVGRASAGDQDSAKKQEANQMPPFVALLLKDGTDNFIKHFDKNKDGALTKDECPPGLAKIFDRVDTNHDGKLDLQERAAWREKQRENYRQQTAARAQPTGGQH